MLVEIKNIRVESEKGNREDDLAGFSTFKGQDECSLELEAVGTSDTMRKHITTCFCFKTRSHP